jgi:hypothetical protein
LATFSEKTNQTSQKITEKEPTGAKKTRKTGEHVEKDNET